MRLIINTYRENKKFILLVFSQRSTIFCYNALYFVAQSLICFHKSYIFLLHYYLGLTLQADRRYHYFLYQ
ncbi:hypothetical protein EA756_11480 [Acinetobacter lactucae]|uniref:Uncharacterized protein n=1 Tax=Acinetobacter lactucae TaxID=1785128 RepID=A0A3R9QFB2_9GAMM|nr:hypothetical protein EA756_11480 [Acinetobacter lactucae]